MKRRELIRHLTRHGCTLLREGSRHSIYRNETGDAAPIPRHAEIDDRLAREICKQLNVAPLGQA